MEWCKEKFAGYASINSPQYDFLGASNESHNYLINLEEFA